MLAVGSANVGMSPNIPEWEAFPDAPSREALSHAPTIMLPITDPMEVDSNVNVNEKIQNVRVDVARLKILDRTEFKRRHKRQRQKRREAEEERRRQLQFRIRPGGSMLRRGGKGVRDSMGDRVG